jgi:hypothetical protein
LEILAVDIQASLDSLRNDSVQETADGDTSGQNKNMVVLSSRLNRLKEEVESMNIGGVNETISLLQSDKWGKPIDDAIVQISRHILLSDYDEAVQGISGVLQNIPALAMSQEVFITDTL